MRSGHSCVSNVPLRIKPFHSLPRSRARVFVGVKHRPSKMSDAVPSSGVFGISSEQVEPITSVRSAEDVDAMRSVAGIG